MVDTGAGAGKARTQWVDEHLKDAGVKLDASARKVIEARIGEDAGLLVGLLPTLEAVYGTGAKSRPRDVEPYLGVEGGVKPWDLTDAIDSGDIGLAPRQAASAAHRQRAASRCRSWPCSRTTTHACWRLDGVGCRRRAGAAEVLGIKGSTFPAKKALSQSRTLGSDRLAEFIRLLAQADLDLKGAKAWPPELVIEVLVARLASRTPRAPPRGSYARR